MCSLREIFSIEFFLKTREIRNYNVAVLHTTLPRAFQPVLEAT